MALVVVGFLAAATAHAQDSAPSGEAPVEAEGPPALVLVCLDIGRNLETCRAGASAFTEETGRDVRVVSATAEGRMTLERYRVLFSVASPLVDVIQFPQDWLPALESDLAPVAAAPEGPLFGTHEHQDERVIALPHLIGTNVIYVREDIFPAPPATWSGMRSVLIERSRLMADGEDLIVGLVFPGEPDRRLVDVTLSVLARSGVDPFVDPATGRVVASDPGTIEALSLLDGLVGTVVGLDEASLTETLAVDRFARGRAAALIASSIHAPEILDDAPVGGLVQIGPVPQPEAAASGGRSVYEIWYLGVSRHTADPSAAGELAAFLVSADVQSNAAIAYGVAPSSEAAYSNPEVLAARPLLGVLGEMIRGGVTAPVEAFGTGWLDATQTVAEAVRNMLTGTATPDMTAVRLQTRLSRIRRGAERME